MKYIIEIKPEYEDKFRGVMILGAENSNLYVDSQAAEELEELTADYINEHYGDLQDDAYNKGYAQCQDDYGDALKHAKDTAYKKGLEDGKKAFDLLDAERDSEYQRGLDDAWECAKKLFSTMSDTEIEKVFPTEWENGFYGLMQMKPQYAIEKLKAYEKKRSDKIEVGDEVIYNGTTKCIVVRPEDDERYASLIDSDGTHYSADHRECKKTGRHFDIDKILEEIAT